MTYQRIEFPQSDGLRREISALKMDVTQDVVRAEFPDRQSLMNYVKTNPYYADFEGTFGGEALGHCKSLLDLGAGKGITSSYLSLKGFNVTCVEPSPSLCQYAVELAKILGVDMRVVNTTSEHAGEIGAGYDIVIFHSSLHHCDDPLLALRNAHSLLNDGGKLFLLCEPILHCFRTKDSFYRELVLHPERTGNYGGNEHVYRLHEYVSMLRAAGFTEVHVKYSPMLFLPPNIPSGTLKTKEYAVRMFYGAMRMAKDLGIARMIQPTLDWMSLGPRVFMGRKDK